MQMGRIQSIGLHRLVNLANDVLGGQVITGRAIGTICEGRTDLHVIRDTAGRAVIAADDPVRALIAKCKVKLGMKHPRRSFHRDDKVAAVEA